MSPHRSARRVAALAAGVLLAVAACSSDPATTTSVSTVVPSATTALAPATTPPATTTPAPMTSDVAATTPDSTIAAAPAPAAPITIRGTAYTFNTPDPIVGAEIRVAELPDVSATTGADGAYELAVPVGAPVTPYIVAAGHHTIYLQTFATTGGDLSEVNFQTPSDDVYDALYGLLQVFLGKGPIDDGCVIVSTVSDAKVVGMTFAQFIAFHPHGVAGVLAGGLPALPPPIYFNDAVLPDQSQTSTSGDGGVIWANVPVGVYQVGAKPAAADDTRSFATFTATCEAGRIINANPPWGLHGRP